jgi:hypothetical protein
MTTHIAIPDEFKERVEAAVKEKLRGDEVVLRIIEKEAISRPDYWERVYVVAWQSESRPEGRDCGTHRVCINSKGDKMLVWGHYDLSREDALQDTTERA